MQAFCTDLEFLRILRYRVVPVPGRRWQQDPVLSSGVGEQFTRRLWGRGNIYQARPGLVTHGHSASLMNPQAREVHALDNRA